MRVLYVGGTCEFCEGFRKNWPSMGWTDTQELVEGRTYTVVDQVKIDVPWPPHKGVGYRLAEIQLPENWGHCSCQFREIDGDAEEWKEMLRKHKSKPKTTEPDAPVKTRELEPA